MSLRYYQAKENKMFPHELTMLLRFVRSSVKIECPVCKKKRRKMWTLLCPFKANPEFRSFNLQWTETLPACTPVCDEHLLKPEIPEDALRGDGYIRAEYDDKGKKKRRRK
jgi:hypothetical protein